MKLIRFASALLVCAVVTALGVIASAADNPLQFADGSPDCADAIAGAVIEWPHTISAVYPDEHYPRSVYQSATIDGIKYAGRLYVSGTPQYDADLGGYLVYYKGTLFGNS